MRIVIYGVILLGLLLAPVRKLDIAELEPVEVVYLDKTADRILLSTDTGAQGRGSTMDAALEDMKQKTPAVIYLDTAEFLIVSENAVNELESVRYYVKDSVRLCVAENPDMKTAARYLKTHGKVPALRQWDYGDIIPTWEP